MWSNIEIYPYDLSFSQYSKPQYRQCQMVENKIRCGGEAMQICARTSELSGDRYEDAMCDYHLASWKQAMLEVVA